MYKWNYALLRNRIKAMYGTQLAFAGSVGMSPKAVSARLNNHVEFRCSEIFRFVDALHFYPSEIGLYFFTPL